jgi:putative membrane protein
MLMRSPFVRFLVRWLVCSLGLWIAAGLLSRSVSYSNDTAVIIIAGLILAIINTILKPIGLFMIVINGFTVYLASRLYSSFHVTNFGAAILVGMVIGLVNYLVTTILESSSSYKTKSQ